MRALSLWQPWASLVPLGFKTIETRSWSTDYGGPLLIHAAKTLRAVPARSTLTLGEVEVERDRAGLLLRGAGWPYRLPLGAFVSRVQLVDVVPTDDVEFYGNTTELLGAPWVQVPEDHPEDAPAYVEVDASERPYGDYSPGRYAWLFADIEPITKPVPARGRQGLWRLPAEVVAGG